MGILARLSGFSKQKEDFVRHHLQERVSNDPIAWGLGVGPDVVSTISTNQLLGMPEATIVTCAETYSKLSASGMSDNEICTRIARHRRVHYSGEDIYELVDLIVKNEHDARVYESLRHALSSTPTERLLSAALRMYGDV